VIAKLSVAQRVVGPGAEETVLRANVIVDSSPNALVTGSVALTDAKREDVSWGRGGRCAQTACIAVVTANSFALTTVMPETLAPVQVSTGNIGYFCFK